jgi:hypothetical protein
MSTPERRLGDRLLAAPAEGVEAELGERCFERLVQTFAETLGISYAFLAEPTRSGSHFRTLAPWQRGAFAPNQACPTPGRTCLS